MPSSKQESSTLQRNIGKGDTYIKNELALAQEKIVKPAPLEAGNFLNVMKSSHPILQSLYL